MEHKPHFSPEQVDEVWDLYVTERMVQLFDKAALNFDETKQALCLICQQPIIREQYHLQATNPDQAWHVHHYDLNQANDELTNLDPMHLQCSPKGECMPVYARP